MPTAASAPTASAPAKPSSVAQMVRAALARYHDGALASSERIALGAGSRYSGGLSPMTASCHRAKNPTTTSATCPARSAEEHGSSLSFTDMASPQEAEALEDGADARHVVREIGRLARRKRARARKLDLHDVDHAPRRRRHNDDLVGKKHGLGNAVGDEQHGLGIGEPQPLQLEIELVAGHGVERAERLVHEKERRVEQQRAADGDALAHA